MAKDRMGGQFGGPAREPSRVIDLTDGGTPEEYVVDPANLDDTPAGMQPTPGVMETSSPPADPDLTTRFAEQEKTILELKQGLTRISQQYEDALEEARLDREMDRLLSSAVTPARLPQQGNGNTAYQLPDGADPNTPVTMGQLTGVLRNHYDSMGPAVQAFAIQAAWDVTDEEVQTLFQERPELRTIPEPTRTLAIRKAVNLMRRRKARAGATTGSPTPATGHETPQERPTRDLAGPVVEHVERPRPGALTPSQEGARGDQVTRLRSTYEQLRYKVANTRDMREKKQLLAQMKATHNKLAQLMGLTDHDLREGWAQGEGRG